MLTVADFSLTLHSLFPFQYVLCAVGYGWSGWPVGIKSVVGLVGWLAGWLRWSVGGFLVKPASWWGMVTKWIQYCVQLCVWRGRWMDRIIDREGRGIL